MNVLEINHLKFRWSPDAPLVLDIPHFSMEAGQKIFLQGPSGSGKSTFLGLIAGVNTPEEGRILLLGQPIHQMRSSQRDHFRANHMGYIFQMFNLLPYLTVTENVVLPCHFSKVRRARAIAKSGSLVQEARRLLNELHLGDRLIRKPVRELSVGQQQRVAAARALIGQPEVVIADEPTSALDADSRTSFLRLLFEECDHQKSTLLFVSHDQALASLFDQHVRLSDMNRASQSGTGGGHGDY